MSLNAVVANCNTDDPFFSWQACEECGNTVGGDRYEIVYRETPKGDLFSAEVCEDCMIALCS